MTNWSERLNRLLFIRTCGIMADVKAEKVEKEGKKKKTEEKEELEVSLWPGD